MPGANRFGVQVGELNDNSHWIKAIWLKCVNRHSVTVYGYRLVLVQKIPQRKINSYDLSKYLCLSIYGNICIEWGEVQSVGQFDPIILESSGLVMLEDGSLLTHNDSGDGPVIYRVSQTGSLLQTIELRGAVAVWIGSPCPWVLVTRNSACLSPTLEIMLPRGHR